MKYTIKEINYVSKKIETKKKRLRRRFLSAYMAAPSRVKGGQLCFSSFSPSCHLRLTLRAITQFTEGKINRGGEVTLYELLPAPLT